MSERRVVILCPGQGAQYTGMGRAWLEASTPAAQTFGAADEILGDRFDRKLSAICFEGPEDVLNRTDVAQPAIYTASVACFQALASKASAAAVAAVAGLSLGEYTALHLAGCITFADGLELVALRGRVMQEAAEGADGGMVALVGADANQAAAVCEQAAEGEVLVPANYNAPGQVVLSGAVAACDRAVDVAGAMGLRATRLAVAGAFHSPLMAPAADRLREALAGVEIAEPRCPVLSNVTGEPHAAAGGGSGGSFADSVRNRLAEQLTSPVSWQQDCEWLVANAEGAGFHELAPGKVLMGLMRRISRETKVKNHDQPSS